jgi:hypothetical protein
LRCTRTPLPVALILLPFAGCIASGADDDGFSVAPPQQDMAVRLSGHHDLAGHPPPHADLAGQPPPPPDMAYVAPPSGNVTTSGGTVNRLLFGFTGDTRPASSGGSYPSVIGQIFAAMAAKNVEFAADLGDHMYCFGCGSSSASTQMNDYVRAAQNNLGSRPLFMTLGNHECADSGSNCSLGGYSPANFTAFMNALGQVSGQSDPYYNIDIQTDAGLARFVIVADNSWDSTQSSWLDSTLSDADANAKYTFVLRHHRINTANTTSTCNDCATIDNMIQSHKYAMYLTAHTHEFKLDSMDGRIVVMGIGGAQPFDGSGSYFGYGIVEQLTNGNLSVKVYDVSSDTVTQSWVLGPNR